MKYCLNCKKQDTHFEGKYCSIKCADLYEGVFKQQEINEMSITEKILLGYKE